MSTPADDCHPHPLALAPSAVAPLGTMEDGMRGDVGWKTTTTNRSGRAWEWCGDERDCSHVLKNDGSRDDSPGKRIMESFDMGAMCKSIVKEFTDPLHHADRAPLCKGGWGENAWTAYVRGLHARNQDTSNASSEYVNYDFEPRDPALAFAREKDDCYGNDTDACNMAPPPGGGGGAREEDEQNADHDVRVNRHAYI